MNGSEVDRGRVGGNRNAVITEGIERNSCSDVLWRRRIKYRIGFIQNPIEQRCRNLLAGLNVLDLAVTPARVVTPTAAKQFVAFDPERAQPRIRFVVEQSIPELRQPRSCATRNDLIKRVKVIERVRRKPGLRMGRRIWRLGARCDGCVRRNG